MTRKLIKLDNPEEFFSRNPSKLKELFSSVKESFQRSDFEEEDIYSHLINPQEIYLIEVDEKIKGMATYTRKSLNNVSSLYVDGIALSPEIQGMGLFGKITDIVYFGEKTISCRTQNPLMYSAMKKYCGLIIPDIGDKGSFLKETQKYLAKDLGCKIDSLGVSRGIYGKNLYGKTPVSQEYSSFFNNDLNLNFNNGDSVLVVGLKRIGVSLW